MILGSSNSTVLRCLLGAAVLGSAGCFSSTGAAGAGGVAARCVVPEDAERLADQVLQLVNLQRAEADLPPVVLNPTLSKMAGDYACRMIEDSFFSHQDPQTGYGPGDRAVTAKYRFYAVGENLAAGQQTPADVMRVWMESATHRGIILDERWKEVGLAVRLGGEYAIYWVQEFGDPADY